MVTSTDRSSYPRPVTPEIGVLRPAKPFSSGCLEALCLHHQLGGGRGDEANQRLAGVLLLTARNYTSRKQREALDLGWQEVDEFDARFSQYLAALPQSDFDVALGDGVVHCCDGRDGPGLWLQFCSDTEAPAG